MDGSQTPIGIQHLTWPGRTSIGLASTISHLRFHPQFHAQKSLSIQFPLAQISDFLLGNTSTLTNPAEPNWNENSFFPVEDQEWQPDEWQPEDQSGDEHLTLVTSPVSAIVQSQENDRIFPQLPVPDETSAKSSNTKSGNTKSGDRKSRSTKSGNTKSSNAKSGNTKSSNAKSDKAKKSKPAQEKPTKAKPRSAKSLSQKSGSKRTRNANLPEQLEHLEQLEQHDLTQVDFPQVPPLQDFATDSGSKEKTESIDKAPSKTTPNTPNTLKTVDARKAEAPSQQSQESGLHRPLEAIEQSSILFDEIQESSNLPKLEEHSLNLFDEIQESESPSLPDAEKSPSLAPDSKREDILEPVVENVIAFNHTDSLDSSEFEPEQPLLKELSQDVNLQRSTSAERSLLTESNQDLNPQQFTSLEGEITNFEANISTNDSTGSKPEILSDPSPELQPSEVQKSEQYPPQSQLSSSEHQLSEQAPELQVPEQESLEFLLSDYQSSRQKPQELQLTEMQLTEQDLSKSNLEESRLSELQLTEVQLPSSQLTEQRSLESNTEELQLPKPQSIPLPLPLPLPELLVAEQKASEQESSESNLEESKYSRLDSPEFGLAESHLTEQQFSSGFNLEEPQLSELQSTELQVPKSPLVEQQFELDIPDLTAQEFLSSEFSGFQETEIIPDSQVQIPESKTGSIDINSIGISRRSESDLDRVNLSQINLESIDPEENNTPPQVDLSDANLNTNSEDIDTSIDSNIGVGVALEQAESSPLLKADNVHTDLLNISPIRPDLVDASDLTDANLIYKDLTNTSDLEVPNLNSPSDNDASDLTDTNLANASNLTDADPTNTFKLGDADSISVSYLTDANPANASDLTDAADLTSATDLTGANLANISNLDTSNLTGIPDLADANITNPGFVDSASTPSLQIEELESSVVMPPETIPQGYATGGQVMAKAAPPSSIAPSDTVPALLTPGEYVINAADAQKNLPVLEHLNRGGHWEDAPLPLSPSLGSNHQISRTIAAANLSSSQAPSSSSQAYASIPRVFRSATPDNTSAAPNSEPWVIDSSDTLQWANVEELLSSSAFNGAKNEAGFWPSAQTVIQRQVGGVRGFAAGGVVTAPSEGGTITVSSSGENEDLSEIDIEPLVQAVYQRLRRRLEFEQERVGSFNPRMLW